MQMLLTKPRSRRAGAGERQCRRTPERGARSRQLKAAVGAGGWLERARRTSRRFLVDFRGACTAAPAALVLLPRESARSRAILAICNRDAWRVVPQGGNTGYCGGATPDESGTPDRAVDCGA